MAFERRKHKRFSATAFLNRPVQLAPLPPYFGYEVQGRLVDLSAGGMAIFIDELIPPEVDFILKITFPDGSLIDTNIKVRYAVRKGGGGYLHGIEFLALTPDMAARIDQMSSDYIDCELRIQTGDEHPCRSTCAFFQMCRKRQKLAAAPARESLELVFRPVAAA